MPRAVGILTKYRRAGKADQLEDHQSGRLPFTLIMQ